jgi:ATP-dependent DNA helicase RecQ
LPVYPALTTTSVAGDEYQADQANSAHQVGNVWNRFMVDPSQLPDGEVLAGPVLLVDDEVDSRWTITVAAWQLTDAGSGPVLPFALRSR